MTAAHDLPSGMGPIPDVHIVPLPRVAMQAFCETQDVASLISASCADRRMEKAHIKVQMGGPAAAIEAYRSAPTPNVILLETISDRDLLIRQLDQLSECCDAGTKVVVIGHVNDVLLYRELVKRGVSEYLIAPLDLLGFIKSLSELFAQADAAPLGRTVAVVGAKGGVGASTIAHNLGWSIARDLSIHTVIADLDLAFGTAGLDFNQDPPQGIAEAILSPERLDNNFVDRLLSKCTDNLSLLAAPATLDRVYDFQETTFDGLRDLLRGMIPCIVLDVPHTWNAWSRRALIQADEIVLVVAPDLANLRNAKSLADVLRAQRPNDHKPRLVVNQVGMPKRSEIAVADFAKALDLEVTATIPFDAALFSMAANNGQMIGEVQAGGKINDTISELGRLVTGRAEHKSNRRSLLDPILSRFARKRA